MSDTATAMMTPAVSDSHSGWWMPLVMGILSILFGLLLFSHPAETAKWVAWLVGIWWLMGGILNLISLFIDRTQWGWKLALGILGIFAGLVVLDAMSKAPLAATVGLAAIWVFVIGIQGVIYGGIEIIQAFQGAGWGVGILGVISLLFGFFLMFNPLAGALALPWLFGILAIAGGIAAIVLAFRFRSA